MKFAGFRYGWSALAVLLALSACSSRVQEPANTVHLATDAKIKGLDPIYADDDYSGSEVGKGYEGLLEYHYLKRPYTLVPNLAESMPEISADGKTFTFKLKKGVLFHDDPCFKDTVGKGREMTVDDIIYSWKRLADPKLASTGYWIFSDKIAGFSAWHDDAAKSGNTDYTKPIEGLTAVDRYTLRVRLLSRNYQFLYMLAMPFSYIVPHEAVEMYDKAFVNHCVGSGPFRLREFNGSLRVVWDRNPTYRHEVYPSEGEPGDKEKGLLEDAGQPLPRADRIVTTVFEEPQPMWLSFLAGKLDSSGIPKDNYSSAITKDKKLSPELTAKGIKLTRAPMLDISHETFNMADPLVGKNKYLRQAISTAYNEAESIDLFFNGRAIPAQGPIPPGLAGYDPNFKNPYVAFDVAKAKQLLAKAGYPDGKGLQPIEYLSTSDSQTRQMNEYLQKSLETIGVKLHISTYSWPEFNASIKNRKGQMWGFAWLADYPDAENFLQLFYSKNASPGSNDSNYSSPAFDKLYEKALTYPDGPERTKIYQEMVKMVTEDCPWLFERTRESWGLTYPWMKNIKYTEPDHTRFKYYRVDPTLKK